MIFIAGASGFAGGHLVNALVKGGFTVKALARSSSAARKLEDLGCAAVIGDITAPESLKGILGPEYSVVHLVGIIAEKGRMTFEHVHVEGTRILVEAAKTSGVRHFLYQSALGADLSGITPYLRTKAQAEGIVKNSGLSYSIFRPSLIIGPWDGFTKKILEMIKLSPVLPVPGDGRSLFQPLYVNDWVTCILKVLENPAGYQGTFELGGPQHLSYTEIVSMIAGISGYRRPALNLPMGLMKLAASFAYVLPSPPVTPDQLRMLELDNITALDAVEKSFGFKPLALKAALQTFLKK